MSYMFNFVIMSSVGTMFGGIMCTPTF